MWGAGLTWMIVPLEHVVEGARERELVGLGLPRDLRQAHEVDHHADGAVRRVPLGLGEHRLEEGQQHAELRAHPVGVEPVKRMQAPQSWTSFLVLSDLYRHLQQPLLQVKRLYQRLLIALLYSASHYQ